MSKSELYNDMSSLGTSFSLIGAIGGTLVGVGCIGTGIYFMVDRRDMPIYIGIIMLVVGIIMIIAGWVYWYMTKHSKPLAAATGGVGIFEMIAGAFKGGR